jgi:cell filamentation protein
VPGYTYPDGLTLKNKLGTNDEGLETDLVAIRLAELRSRNAPAGNFDAAHLRAIHRQLFQDVYEWAGRTRDERVVLSDGTVASEPNLRKPDGQPFMAGDQIPAALAAIETRLREGSFLRGLPREEFAERAADLMAELNAVHPFREGNGRTQRVFVEHLAHAAGHDLDFSVVSKERMIQASIAANDHGDPSMMRRMFDEISDPRRVALLRESISALEGLNFDWNNRYIATLTPGHTVKLVLAGIAGDQFMARTSDQVLFGRTADLPQPHPQRGETFDFTPPRELRREQQGEGGLTFFEDRNPERDQGRER